MVRATKSGRLTTTKSITINNIQELGSRERWRDRENSCLPKVKFISVTFKMAIPTASAQESGQTVMCIRASSLMVSSRVKVFSNVKRDVGRMKESGKTVR